jgi:hypothetical protein
MTESFTFGNDQANLPRFKKFRNLKLDFLRFDDNNIVDALLEPSLSVLDLNYTRNDLLLEHALRRRGRIPSRQQRIQSIYTSRF